MSRLNGPAWEVVWIYWRLFSRLKLPLLQSWWILFFVASFIFFLTRYFSWLNICMASGRSDPSHQSGQWRQQSQGRHQEPGNFQAADDREQQRPEGQQSGTQEPPGREERNPDHWERASLCSHWELEGEQYSGNDKQNPCASRVSIPPESPYFSFIHFFVSE